MCLEKVKQNETGLSFRAQAPSCFLSASPYLLFDIVDLGSQPLDHPVHLRDLMLGAAEIIAVSASCLLQLLILVPPEKRKDSIYMRVETLCQHS